VILGVTVRERTRRERSRVCFELEVRRVLLEVVL